MHGAVTVCEPRKVLEWMVGVTGIEPVTPAV
jgi:hypothetical protein